MLESSGDTWEHERSQAGGCAWRQFTGFLQIGNTLKSAVLNELNGLVSEENIVAVDNELSEKEIDAYVVVDKQTGLISSIEISITPYYIQRRTPTDPIHSNLTIRADIYDYEENLDIELPQEAKEAEVVEGLVIPI